MLSFLPLIGLFANVIMQAIGSTGIVSTQTTSLVTGLVSGVVPLISNLAGGQTKLQDVLAVLAGLTSIIATLKADTALPADTLALLTKLDGEVQAAITGYVTAGSGFNAATYSQLAPVV